LSLSRYASQLVVLVLGWCCGGCRNPWSTDRDVPNFSPPQPYWWLSRRGPRPARLYGRKRWPCWVPRALPLAGHLARTATVAVGWARRWGTPWTRESWGWS